jgi:PAS domain S-box-containing protein
MSRSGAKWMFGHTLAPSLACIALLIFLSISPRLNAAETNSLLFVGDKDYAPLTYLDNQQPSGMAVDVVKALAGPMKRSVRIELMDWNLAQQKVLNGEADAVLELSTSEDRLKLYDFASATFTHEFGFVMRSGSSPTWTINDLKGKNIGVTSGGYPRSFLASQPALHLVIIDNYKDGFERLKAGKLDAVAADLWVAAFLIERGQVSGVSIVGEPFATGHAAIAVKRGNTALAREITRGIDQLRAAGILSRIEETWRPQEVVFASRQKIKNLATVTIVIFLAVLLTALALWVLTLKKQIRLRKATEAALRENEEHLRNLTRAAFEGIAISENGRLLDVNDQMLGMFGYERGEIIGMMIRDIVAPESRAVVEEAIRSGRESIYEHRLLRKDGSSFIAEARAQVVHMGGRTLRLTALRDITDRKFNEELNKTQSKVLEMVTRGEALIKTLDTLLRMIEAQSPEMLCSILLLEADGVHVRHAAAPSLPKEYLKGVDGSAIGPCAGSCGTAAHRREMVFVSDIESDPLWKDYKHLALPYGLLACWSTPIFDAQRHVLGTFATFYRTKGLPTQRHISMIETATHTAAVCINKHRADAALHESEERFRALVEYSPDCIAVAVDERLVYLNPAGAKLIGAKDAGDVLGRSAFEFVPSEMHPVMQERRKSVLQAGISSPVMEFPLLRLDGSSVLVESQAVPFIYGGKPAILNLIRDVTGRKRAEVERGEAADREKKAREEFTHLLIASQEAERHRIAGELHDGLGQNLSIVKNRSLLAQRDPAIPAAVAEHLQSIERIVSGAIDETRNLAHNLRPAHIEQVGLTASLQQLIREVSKSSEIHFERRVENVDGIFNREAATNVYRIAQEALNNLCKHSRAEQAMITIERDVRAVHMRITDDGVGFDTAKAMSQGGLGLTSIAERVRMLGGRLDIDSSPGKGTRLTIELPVAEADETPAEKSHNHSRL